MTVTNAWTVIEAVIVNVVVVADEGFAEAILEGTEIDILLVGTRAPLHDGGSPLHLDDETEIDIFLLIGDEMHDLDLVDAAHLHRLAGPDHLPVVAGELRRHLSHVHPRVVEEDTATRLGPDLDLVAGIGAVETRCDRIGLGQLPPVINRAHLPLDVVLDPHHHVDIGVTALGPDLSP